jgi:pimeloyl-ACP methyl ester carboxylesterase
MADVKLHVEDGGGSGRPVVLIHGWPLSGAAWSKQVPALTQAGFRVVTYDRRGFGKSEKPASGFDYDTLSKDLDGVIKDLALTNVSLVGFSMGGGEVARYASAFGQDKLHSVVFASAVPPYLMKTNDNPDGPLTKDEAAEMESGLEADRTTFLEQFTKDYFSAAGVLKVTEAERQEAIVLCQQSDQAAALGARIHKAIAGKLVVLKGAPHGVNVSHPSEFTKHSSISWLARPHRPSSSKKAAHGRPFLIPVIF